MGSFISLESRKQLTTVVQECVSWLKSMENAHHKQNLTRFGICFTGFTTSLITLRNLVLELNGHYRQKSLLIISMLNRTLSYMSMAISVRGNLNNSSDYYHFPESDTSSEYFTDLENSLFELELLFELEVDWSGKL